MKGKYFWVNLFCFFLPHFTSKIEYDDDLFQGKLSEKASGGNFSYLLVGRSIQVVNNRTITKSMVCIPIRTAKIVSIHVPTLVYLDIRRVGH
jgi:hypothetical protein